MFKNRHFQVRLVRDNSQDPTQEQEFEMSNPIDYEKIEQLIDKSSQSFRDNAEFVIKRIGIGVVAFVAADTLRQVIVKLTPSN